MSYDSKCYELALVFLADTDCHTREDSLVIKAELAQVIQDAIESYLNMTFPQPGHERGW